MLTLILVMLIDGVADAPAWDVQGRIRLLLYSPEFMVGKRPTLVIGLVYNAGESPVFVYRLPLFWRVGVELRCNKEVLYKHYRVFEPTRPRTVKEVLANILSIEPGEAFGQGITASLLMAWDWLKENARKRSASARWQVRINVRLYCPPLTSKDGRVPEKIRRRVLITDLQSDWIDISVASENSE